MKKFLFDHIEVAFKKGFDDNTGRHAITVTNYFEVCNKIFYFNENCVLNLFIVIMINIVEKLKIHLSIIKKFKFKLNRHKHFCKINNS